MAQVSPTILNGTITGSDMQIPFGGTYMVEASSTGWNGATATLQVKTAAGTYVSVGAAGVFTADGIAAVVIGDGAVVRVAVSVAVPTQPVIVVLRRADG